MAYLYENLLSAAEQLLDIERVGTAGRRRSISTAYYAVFRRLSSLCAASFALPPPMDRDTYDAVLRSLKHSEVGRALNQKTAQDLVGKEVGKLFGELLSGREWADYSSASHVSADKAKNGDKMTRAEAAKYVSDARAIIAAIDALDERSSHKLAIILAFSGKR
jgi:uncharacterized protein (UPF0332 family)